MLNPQHISILGVVGLQRAVHWRNRVVLDDILQNGITTWLVSSEPETIHMTNLNAMALFSEN